MECAGQPGVCPAPVQPYSYTATSFNLELISIQRTRGVGKACGKLALVACEEAGAGPHGQHTKMLPWADAACAGAGPPPRARQGKHLVRSWLSHGTLAALRIPCIAIRLRTGFKAQGPGSEKQGKERASKSEGVKNTEIDQNCTKLTKRTVF